MSMKKQPISVYLSAAELVISIDHLIQEILVRLPAKSVTRFKLVSKHWYSLISDTQFVQSHIRRNRFTSALFLNNFGGVNFVWLSVNTETSQAAVGRSSPSLGFLNGICGDRYHLRLLQSLNGLWLCRFTYGDGSSYCDMTDICVCNPTTKQYRLLPRPKDTSTSEKWRFCGVGFAYDPSISLHYKVVCVKYFYDGLQSRTKTSFRVEVYSSEDNSWRSLLEFDEFGLSSFSHHDDRPFWNGGIHKVGNRAFHFDLYSESVLQAEMPRIPWTLDGSGEHVTVCGRREAYLYLLGGSKKKLYVLEMSGCKWVIKWKVDFCVLTSAYPEMVNRLTSCEDDGHEEVRYVFSILDVIERPENKESAVLVLAVPGKIVSYNFVKKTVKTLHGSPNVEVTKDGKSCVPAFQFIESLSSV